jgi:hypothetical protein
MAVGLKGFTDVKALAYLLFVGGIFLRY